MLFLLLLFLLAGCGMSDAPTVGLEAEFNTPRLLFLYGERISKRHRFHVNAVRFARRQNFELDELPFEAIDGFGETTLQDYSAIIFSDYADYMEMPSRNRTLLDEFCRKMGSGLFFLSVVRGTKLNGGEVVSSRGHSFHEHDIQADKEFLALTRDGGPFHKKTYGHYFEIKKGSGYRSVLSSEWRGTLLPTILLDEGRYDGVKRVFMGLDFSNHWLNQLLFLDALAWLASGDLHIPKTRWLGVDIDDIFLSTSPALGGIKIQPNDVMAILEDQAEISQLIGSEFRYHLGYNSGWYGKSYAVDDTESAQADRAFLRHRGEFFWFDHLPGHQKSSAHSFERLEELMETSKRWAFEHGLLDYIDTYHVPPYHDGVFPVYEPLYHAWRNVWNSGYTSTVFVTQGFIKNGIYVAPRTDLGLPYDWYSWDQLDKSYMERAARGGYLFRRMLNNPVSIFMAHQANYAGDRLASHVFLQLIRFTTRWTNLELINLPGSGLVRKYFELGAPVYIN